MLQVSRDPFFIYKLTRVVQDVAVFSAASTHS